MCEFNKKKKRKNNVRVQEANFSLAKRRFRPPLGDLPRTIIVSIAIRRRRTRDSVILTVQKFSENGSRPLTKSIIHRHRRTVAVDESFAVRDRRRRRRPSGGTRSSAER